MGIFGTAGGDALPIALSAFLEGRNSSSPGKLITALPDRQAQTVLRLQIAWDRLTPVVVVLMECWAAKS